MAATRIGINGFGRIGRQSLKAIIERHPEVEVVAINDITDTETNAHLFRYDSTYGRFPGTVEVADNNDIRINGRTIRVFSDRDPGTIPWGSEGVEIVIESTGFFTDAAKAAAHKRDSVKKVIISAPAKGEDLTIVLGVNEDKYDPEKHHIVSNASCTTNGLAPVAKVLNDRWDIKTGLLTTIHSYTNSQRLLDVATTDLRDARAAGLNIVPSTTGAARAVGLVIPELKGRFTGMSFRVPTPTVSVVDFTADLEREATVEEMNAAFKEAAAGSMQGIMAYSEEPLVSMDLKGDTHSSIVSGLDNIAIGTMVKVVAWYDNEWGYSCRISDLTAFIAEKL